MIDLVKLVDEVKIIVKKASSLMRESFKISVKATDVNIVTTSDLNVQRFLVDNLAMLVPESGFLCEEENLADDLKEWVWIIDPIDGTTNYARGIPDCCISVGLVKNGEPVLGVVFNPYQDELFSAVKGFGAFLNGNPINVSNKPFSQGIICTAMSLYNKSLAKACNDIIFETYMQANDFRRFGSCALELCYLAMGRCDLFFEMRVFPWDYCAGIVILTEAGGSICSLHKTVPSLKKPSLIIAANNSENLDRLSVIIDKYVK
ncbi:MAG: inositol monophosphatase [Clostridia bacterium]|nr:inositol monophosphatase [Clostridia bacterium]